jgi:hypothetical protein
MGGRRDWREKVLANLPCGGAKANRRGVQALRMNENGGFHEAGFLIFGL